MDNAVTDYRHIKSAIEYIEANSRNQPSLDNVAHHIGMSLFHFQKMFKRWAGVSPKRFLQYLTVEHAKAWLNSSTSVLNTTYEVGLSSPGRLHDLFVHVEAMTPGEYKTMGKGLTITYGFYNTPYGTCLLATTPKGITNLIFIDDDQQEDVLSVVIKMWPNATLYQDKTDTHPYIDQIFNTPHHQLSPLPILVKGTNFQLKVWEALLRIPQGNITSYGDLAHHIGHDGASRAVGTAVGNNPIAYIIPCHRVLRATGNIGGYRWGIARKKAMLVKESIGSNR